MMNNKKFYLLTHKSGQNLDITGTCSRCEKLGEIVAMDAEGYYICKNCYKKINQETEESKMMDWSDNNNGNKEKKIMSKKLIIAGILLGVFAIVGFMWGYPRYNVYKQSLAGEAELARASQNRQIKIQEANAKKEAAILEAQAEVERAKGVAEANKIIGESLKGNEAYLRYLWINGLQEGATPQVIYVPTEAGLPILEAGRVPNK